MLGERPRATPKTTGHLLEIADLSVEIQTSRGALRVLNEVSLNIETEEVLALVGESGSGKSMTANAILGLLPPGAQLVRGEVRLRGTPVTELPPGKLREIRGKRVGTILQDPLASLNPVHRIGRQVAEPLRAHGLSSSATALARAVEMLGHVGILNPSQRARDYPHQFSGGMRQRIVGAAAVICSPELLIADEPTTALDVTAQAAYLDLLGRLQQETKSGMLFITHDLNVVRRLADRVAVMYGGRIMEVGPKDQVFESPGHPYTMGLLNSLPTAARARLVSIPGSPPDPAALPPGCPFAPRCPSHLAACDEAPPPLQAVNGDHRVACIRAGEPLKPSSVWPSVTESVSATVAENSHPIEGRRASEVPVLALQDAVVEYGRRGSAGLVRALVGVSLDVSDGASLAIVGESGSGKTTCAKLLLGLERPSAGHAFFRGADIFALRGVENRRYRQTVQAVFQDPFSSLNPRMTINEIVAEPLRELGVDRSSANERRSKVGAALVDVGLDPGTVASAYPHQLSGGQRQRVAIARAMVVEPAFLVLDEPVSSLDVSVRAQVMNLLYDLKAEHGTGFVTISHDLISVRYLSAKIVVLYRGRIVEASDTEALFAEPRHPYSVQLLRDALLEGPSERATRPEKPATRTEASQSNDRGCVYFETCPLRMAICAEVEPELVAMPDGRSVACHAVTQRIMGTSSSSAAIAAARKKFAASGSGN